MNTIRVPPEEISIRMLLVGMVRDGRLELWYGMVGEIVGGSGKFSPDPDPTLAM